MITVVMMSVMVMTMTCMMMTMMIMTSMMVMMMQVSVYRDGSLRRHPVNSLLVRTTLENISQASLFVKISL